MILTTASWTPLVPYSLHTSSPLSLRSVNACPHTFSSAAMSSPLDTKLDVPFSKRVAKPNPLLRSQDSIRERRRDAFLKRVQQDREDKRWEARGDQILRLDYLTHKQRWEAERAEIAKAYEAPLDEESEDELPTFKITQVSFKSQTDSSLSGQMPFSEEEEADIIAQQEEQELEAYISMAETGTPVNYTDEHFGSDEEDYDSLFMEFSRTENELQSNFASVPDSMYPLMDDSMDTSNG